MTSPPSPFPGPLYRDFLRTEHGFSMPFLHSHFFDLAEKGALLPLSLFRNSFIWTKEYVASDVWGVTPHASLPTLE
jgi:hypothetical protein